MEIRESAKNPKRVGAAPKTERLRAARRTPARIVVTVPVTSGSHALIAQYKPVVVTATYAGLSIASHPG